MFYFLTCTAKRKNARRHIVSIYDTLVEVINHPLLNTANPYQYYDLYNSKWELIKEGIMTHHQLTLSEIKRIFDDFLIATGIKQYDHTSAIHTSLLYEYCLGRAIAQGYTLKDYSGLMYRMTRYAIEKSRECAGDE